MSGACFRFRSAAPRFESGNELPRSKIFQSGERLAALQKWTYNTPDDEYTPENSFPYRDLRFITLHPIFTIAPAKLQGAV